ncbi:hypothetical protein [Prosthecobacter vanneervenii]|uniref:Uncharacterized protein n=1 Tax=Prosthecobacter vanneervenii TaxID=48466 RepID=A0A7W8DI56_9BACT|nr:hypothetical protein [Prosthecobacter vanneervenii]MBB5030531.1 hypothetical protein [Prosthecobacter vanneervenii]
MDWLVPSGRYHATLADVVPYHKKPGQFRLIFKIPRQGALDQDRKAAKIYDPDAPHWLERDLRAWLTEDQLSQYFPDGEAGQAELKALIGARAVLVITNEDRGQTNPLVCISEILPCKRQFLEGTATEPAGRKFRFSFAAAA